MTKATAEDRALLADMIAANDATLAAIQAYAHENGYLATQPAHHVGGKVVTVELATAADSCPSKPVDTNDPRR